MIADTQMKMSLMMFPMKSVEAETVSDIELLEGIGLNPATQP